MKQDDLVFVARPRRPWEAVDLGVRMAQVWWRPLIGAWLLLAVPVLLILWLLPVPDAWVPWLLWWLKPVFERPLLFILSRAVFGVVPGWRVLISQLPQLMSSQWFASLTWRRLSPTRCYDLPVLLLEGLDGKERRQRLSVLHREQASQATWLTLLGVHLEALLAGSMMLLVGMLLPDILAGDWLDLVLTQNELLHILMLVGMALVAPFYVAGGFALYLNRRIELEAWDIDLVFRRLAARLSRVTPVLVMALLVGLTAGQVAPVNAEPHLPPGHPPVDVLPPFDPELELPQVPATDVNDLSAMAPAGLPSPSEARARIQQIIHSEELEQRRVTRYPKFLEDWKLDSEDQADPPPLWLVELVQMLARGVEWLAWGLALAIAVLVALRYRVWHRWFKAIAQRPQQAPPAPEVLFGLDLRAQSLPNRPGEEARQLWQQGETRAAVALLYRSALSRLIHEQGYAFQSGDTEQDCLARVRAREEGELAWFFMQLTATWQQLAYGHVAPDDSAFEDLCAGWERHFASGEVA